MTAVLSAGSTLTVHAAEQGTPEWLAARCGLITASVIGGMITSCDLGAIDFGCPDCGAEPFDPCRSKAKNADGAAIKTLHPARAEVATDSTLPPVLSVADNDTSRGITLKLAAERITQYVEETFVTSAMYRGKEEEPLARDKYAETYAPVTESGLMVRDFGTCRIGYSPDGLVGDDGLIEIKSRSPKVQVAHILNGEVPAAVMPQIQTGLLVSGRQWLDYVSYSGGMAMWVKRVYPDPRWQNVILAVAEQFEQNAEDIYNRYLTATDGLPTTERTPDYDQELVI